MTFTFLLCSTLLLVAPAPSATMIDAAPSAEACVPAPIYTVTFSPEAAQETVDRLWEQNPRDGTIVVVSGGTVSVTFPEGTVPNLDRIAGEPGVTVTVTP